MPRIFLCFALSCCYLLGHAYQSAPAFDEAQALKISQAALGRALSNHQLRDRYGRMLTLHQLRSRPLVISMIYTSCYHTCPMLTRHLAAVVDTARAALGNSFAVATIGFDSTQDTPARMLAPLVVSALESTGAFKAVLTPPTPALDDLRLDIDIIRLQQEFLRQPSEVRLIARAKLFDVASGRVATRLFETDAPSPTEDAYGGIKAANVAVERFLTQLSDFVIEHAYDE